MFAMAKPAECKLARELRRDGLPYKRIAAQLGVSPSSAHLWTRDIVLTEEQKAFNLRGPPWAAESGSRSPPCRKLGRKVPCHEAGVSRGGPGDGAARRPASPCRLHALLGRGGEVTQ